MSCAVELAPQTEQCAQLVVLTVYARADTSVCGRVLQVLTMRQVVVERLVADFSRFDHSEIKGLADVVEPVMRISVAASVPGERGANQLTKFLNRIVDLYKIEVTLKI